MSARGSVYSWCGCRDPANGRAAGEPLPAAREGQVTGAGTCHWNCPPGLTGDRRRIRRGGLPDQKGGREGTRPAADARGRGSGPDDGESGCTGGSRSGPGRVSHDARVRRARPAVPQTVLGHILLTDLTAQHVQAMFTAIGRQHEAEGSPVTAATLASIRTTLRAALNAASARD